MSTLRTTTAAVAASLALSLLGGAAEAAPPVKGVGAPGMELTARWWTAALASGDLTFFEDSRDGDNCVTVELPRGTLVLVAGTLGGASGPRACTIPAGSTVVLPVVNTIFFATDPVPADTIGEGRRDTRQFIDAASAAASVDGRAVRVRRIRSSRFLVNATAVGVPRPVPAVSDGYWLVFEATRGVHAVTTSGSAAGGFSSSTTYTFTVV